MSSPVVSVKRTLFEEYVVAVTPVVGVIAFIFVIASDTLELLMEKLLVEVPFKATDRSSTREPHFGELIKMYILPMSVC